MGIKILSPVVLPSVSYENIHMTKLEIDQPIFADDTSAPVYKVCIHYRHYGVVNSVRYYKEEDVNRVSLPDFLIKAMEKAATGNMVMLNALQSIEVAIAAIIQEETSEITEVV